MDKNQQILVVDDEPPIVRALSMNLEAVGYQVHAVATGEEALHSAAEIRPDAVILDLGLPGIGGIKVIGLRSWTNVPIIAFTAGDKEGSEMAALDAGADDYLTKPFGMGELLGRLRAALKRAASWSEGIPTVTTEHFSINLWEKNVTAYDRGEIKLTPTECGVVEALVRKSGQPVTPVELLTEVWGSSYGGEANSVRRLIAQIRRKLEPDPSAPIYFISEPGQGYLFMNLGKERPIPTAR